MNSENDITDIIDETFTTTEDRFGEMVTVDLKPGGADVPVTEENKKEYVDLVVEYRISKRVKEQFDAFMSGFSELIPQDLITVFDERELELLIGGMSEIDVYVSLPRPSSTTTDTLTSAMTGPDIPTTAVTNKPTRSSSGSGNAFAHGLQSANLVSCNSQLAHRVYQSTGLKTSKVRTGRDGLRLKNPATHRSCQRVTRASIGLIYHHIKTMQVWSRS